MNYFERRMHLLISLLVFFLEHVTSNDITTSSSSQSLKVPHQCRWESASEGVVICLQREPAVTKLNLSEIPADALTSLSLYCLTDNQNNNNNNNNEDSEVINLASYEHTIFGPEELSHFWRLRAVQIVGCRVRRLTAKVLNGLRDLRNLTIKTDSGELKEDQEQVEDEYDVSGGISSKLALELEAGTFETVTQLEKIDLSFNNIWQIPSQLFCPLANLVSLNLSYNLLEDLAELKFGSRSERKPRRLDYQVQQRHHLPLHTCLPALWILEFWMFRTIELQLYRQESLVLCDDSVISIFLAMT